MSAPLCATRPADWWTLGDGGNRLALMLCGVCPARVRCAAMARREAGVIRAGVAYADTGRVLPSCPNCAYPVGSARCRRCYPLLQVPPWWRRWSRHARRDDRRQAA